MAVEGADFSDDVEAFREKGAKWGEDFAIAHMRARLAFRTADEDQAGRLTQGLITAISSYDIELARRGANDAQRAAHAAAAAVAMKAQIGRVAYLPSAWLQ
jgi:hypothetical protein